MDKGIYDMKGIDIAWCPGCGNFPILEALKDALSELGKTPRDVVIVSGIGQAAKLPHYLRCNAFNGLHGRSLPLATGIKAANPGLTVIAESGDGCMYGEGGNHLIHTIRRNPDITCIVHNNMIYGLTKGQASPTSPLGLVTPVQVHGVTEEPFNPVAMALSLGVSFVARAFAGDRKETRDMIMAGIGHKGFALVDIFQPCVSFNRLNTYKWFKENTYYLEEPYESTDRISAMEKAFEEDRLPLGVFYTDSARPSFEETLKTYQVSEEPLYLRYVNKAGLRNMVEAKRG